MLWLSSISEWVKHKQVILLLMLIIVTGAFLRLYNLGSESIWLDEAASINLSSQSVASIVEESPNQNHPPLYFIILHFWIKAFGTSEVATRSLSAVLGILSILLIYQVGSLLFTKRVGLISGFLSAISYYHIYYSQEVRTLSPLLFLSLLSYLLFIKILKGDRKWYYPCYFLANLLLGYTHIFGLFIIASQIIYFLLFWSNYKQQRAKLLSTVVVTIVTLFPLVPLIYGRAAALAEHGFWIPAPGLGSIFNTLVRYAGAGPGREFILLTFFLLIVVGFFSIEVVGGRWNQAKPLASLESVRCSIKFGSIEQDLLLIMWLSLPILIPFVESYFMTPIYAIRYLICASPAFYLLVARGMGNLHWKYIFYPILIFIVFLSFFGLQQYYSNPGKAQWREAAVFIEMNSNADSDVAVFCASFFQNPFNYYYKGELERLGISNRVSDIQKLGAFVDSAVDGKDRLWLILDSGSQTAPIRGYLVDRYGSKSIILEKEFHRISIILIDLSTL